MLISISLKKTCNIDSGVCVLEKRFAITISHIMHSYIMHSYTPNIMRKAVANIYIYGIGKIIGQKNHYGQEIFLHPSIFHGGLTRSGGKNNRQT